MQIGALAKESGVSVQTVRYYERLGLMPAPERKPSKYRVYTQDHMRRLQFILHAKALGFTLNEIKEILELSRKQQCPCGQVLRIAEQRLDEISKQLKQLERFRRELARAVSSWKKCPQQAPSGDAICVLIERTMLEQEKNRISRKGGKSHGTQDRRDLQVSRSRMRV